MSEASLFSLNRKATLALLERQLLVQAQQEAAEEASGDENHSPLPPRKATPARAAQRAPPGSTKKTPSKDLNHEPSIHLSVFLTEVP